MYMPYAPGMSEKEQTTEQQQSELEREERRLERLRLVVNAWPPQEHFDDEPPPQTAA